MGSAISTMPAHALNPDSADFSKLERPWQRQSALAKMEMPDDEDNVIELSLDQLKLATDGIASDVQTSKIWHRLCHTETIAQAFDELDADNDGIVTRGELYKAMVGRRKAYFSSLLGGNEWKHICRIIDVDGDGEITLAELARVVTFTDLERQDAEAEAAEKKRDKKARKNRRLARTAASTVVSSPRNTGQ